MAELFPVTAGLLFQYHFGFVGGCKVGDRQWGNEALYDLFKYRQRTFPVSDSSLTMVEGSFRL